MLLVQSLLNWTTDNANIAAFQRTSRISDHLAKLIAEKVHKLIDIRQETVSQLRVLIESKNYFGVEALVEKLTLSDETAKLLLKLPELFGSGDIIAEARSMTCNAEALKALDEIEKLCQLIAEYGFEKYITIDLGMLTEYDYYTGMIFRGYTYGTGDAVVKGGRYDHLIGQFGKDAASVGFAVVLDELMLALSRQKIDIPTNEEATMVLYEPEYRSTAIRIANALRNINQAVSMMKKETDRSLNDYKAYSRRYHIAHILYVDQDKELTKIDISDDSVRKMPVSEF